MKKIIYAILILSGILLRVLYLNQVPKGLFRDEAAMGYNAYSILMTGKDEYGMPFPLLVRSFEQFFLPLYTYLSIPVIKLFGLGIFSIRLVTAIAGILGFYAIFLIAKELFNRNVALVAVAVLVISPWSIFYSRGAFEGMVGLTLFSFGFYFLIRFFKFKSSRAIIFSILCFVISLYAYHSERLVVPSLALSALLLNYKLVWGLRKKLIIPISIGVILGLPLLFVSLKPAGYHRDLGVSVFSEAYFQNSNLYLRIRQVLSLYVSYFSPRNLFFEGEPDLQRSVVHYSTFYAWMLPFLVIGLWNFVRDLSKERKLLLSWMLLGPLPAAFTTDPFHVHRALLMFMPLTLVLALGIFDVFVVLKKKFRFIFLVGIWSLSIISVSGFLYSYGVLNFIIPERLHHWDWPYESIVSFTNALPKETRVVVDDKATEAYIHFLFRNRIDPSQYQSEVSKLGDINKYYYADPSEIRPVKVGSYEFRNVDWPSERGDSGTVFVLTAEELPVSEFVTDPKVELLKEIKYPNGEVGYRIVRIK